MSETTYSAEPTDEYWPGEWVAPEAIEPNDWNPNELEDDEFERLKQSIMDNGWTMPIVVHAEENYIIDGEHRWAAAQELDDDPDLTPEGTPSHFVPVYGITVSNEQAKLATVQHNRARGSVDVPRLQNYLDDLDSRGVLADVQDRIGIEDDTISELLGEITTPDLPDDTMPWEEDDDEDDESSSESTTETPMPEFHEDRTKALRGTVEDPDNVESITETLSEDEYKQVCEALGSEMRAQSLVNAARFVSDKEAVDSLAEFVHR